MGKYLKIHEFNTIKQGGVLFVICNHCNFNSDLHFRLADREKNKNH